MITLTLSEMKGFRLQGFNNASPERLKWAWPPPSRPGKAALD